MQRNVQMRRPCNVVLLFRPRREDGKEGGVLIDGPSCPGGEEHRQTAGHL